MGQCMAAGVGVAMGLIERVSRSIALGETVFEDGPIERDARHILASESPWLAGQAARSVVDEITGLGPVQKLFDDASVTDILVNGPGEIWVDRGDSLELTDQRFGSVEHLVGTIERAIAPLGLRIDRSMPMLEARLRDGSRLHAMLPPAAVDYPLMAIRRFSQRVESLGDLVALGTATDDQAESLATAVRERRTIVVSGGTGSGKTTLLNLLGRGISSGERVVTIEDAAELDIGGHVVRLESRPPNAEGEGEITIRTLLRSALRLRPDRIVIGEVRGAETLDLISALNTGHRGSMTTVHANSPREAMWRLETLAMSGGSTSETAVRRQLWTAVDMVVQLERTSTGRIISEISGVEELKGESL